MSLSEQDREILWSGIRRARHEDAPVPLAHEANADHVLWAVTPAVEAIVARHVAAALERAAERVAEFDEDDNFHEGEFIQAGYGYYAAIERVRLLLTGQIDDWRDRKPTN